MLKAINSSPGPSRFFMCISWSDKKSLISTHKVYLTCILRALWLHNIVKICQYLSFNQYLPEYPCGLTCKLLSLSALRTNLGSWKYFQILQNQHLHYWKELIVDFIYSRQNPTWIFFSFVEYNQLTKKKKTIQQRNYCLNKDVLKNIGKLRLVALCKISFILFHRHKIFKTTEKTL